MQQDTITTVAVVGAGLAGLSAARDLHRAGIDVLVLEAADRVGGRAMAVTTALGSRVDLGGQWIGHDHHRIIAAADELGLHRYPMRTQPLPRVLAGSRRLHPAGAAMLTAGLALAGVEVLSRVGTPVRWNTVTLDRWLNRVPVPAARRLLEVLAAVSWTADPDRLSVHAAATMLARQGGLRTILSTTGGAQESLLVEGIGTLADLLAEGLGPRIRLGDPVTAISHTDDGITLHTGTGRVRATKTIITVPAPMAARIDFRPALPADRAAIGRASYMGSVYKALAIYPRPFWRGRHGAEFIVLDRPGRAVFDSGPPGGPGHLCMLVGGPEARELDALDPDTRRAALLTPLADHLGPELLEPADWQEKSWHRDEFAGGGYLAMPAPGSTAGLLPVDSAPIGDLHWAGTETAEEHPGYLEGALCSGARAAAEVIAALAR